MLDIKFIREHKDLIAEAIRKKHIDLEVDNLVGIDDERITQLSRVEEMRAKQNRATEKISGKISEIDRQKIIAEMKVLKEKLQKEEEKLKKVMKRWHELMLLVPNIPDASVPEGNSDEENKEIRTWGDKPNLQIEPKSHIDLMTKLNMVDFERGVKTSGFRGYFLKREGATLSLALWQFATSSLMKKGYQPMIVPSLVRKETLYGTGYLPQGEDDLYKNQDDSYMAGTSEVALMSYYSDEILNEKDLPQKMLAFSPCFRREAGSHGKDSKGLIRVHEFYKVEQVILCEASHQASVNFHEELTSNAEELVKALKLPYRVVINCAGDLGLGQVKKYDIEIWMPGEKKYRESHSSSYFHDFQSRRLNIKYEGLDGKKRFAHSLNCTAYATPRIIAAIVENFQREDGTIEIPEVLQQYIGKKVIS